MFSNTETEEVMSPERDVVDVQEEILEYESSLNVEGNADELSLWSLDWTAACDITKATEHQEQK